MYKLIHLFSQSVNNYSFNLSVKPFIHLIRLRFVRSLFHHPVSLQSTRQWKVIHSFIYLGCHSFIIHVFIHSVVNRWSLIIYSFMYLFSRSVRFLYNPPHRHNWLRRSWLYLCMWWCCLRKETSLPLHCVTDHKAICTSVPTSYVNKGQALLKHHFDHSSCTQYQDVNETVRNCLIVSAVQQRSCRWVMQKLYYYT